MIRKPPASFAEIIAIGSELLLGGRLDSNSLFLTEALAREGIEVRYKSVVGDAVRDIARAIGIATRRARWIVMTGGLGPTSDDCTKEAVSFVTKRPLQVRAEALRQMTERLAKWNRVPNDAQLRQALIPRGALVMANPVGSAPGFAVRHGQALIAALPGPPAEAQQMFETAVVPLIRASQKGGMGTRPAVRIIRRLVHTFGLPESEVQAKIAHLLSPGSPIRLGIYASPLGVSVSLTVIDEGRGRPPASSSLDRGRSVGEEAVERILGAMRDQLAPFIYADEADTMESVVGRLLSQQSLTLAVAESCTGGLIGHRLTQVAGSSSYFEGGVICYSNRMKQDWLAVPEPLLQEHGAVSAEVAAAMARSIRARSGASLG
ncbi:MAG TPA: CinA family nicotinamide mononucleotide deamidase-related protein, partial [Nitrospiraceae bacterium]|nr:CinA family nicotinamide mononucleotide deamidase-related protein [Nitrospiraceae bacterium]